ncbi:MAG: hypothetical protein JNL21_11525 [Myxococcales bacterium]|nr:hypothetical protein [Myxococcales bacterium]
MAFVATLAYELDPSTSPQAAKLLVAELVGRRYNDRFEGKRMPANVLWIRRAGEPSETVDDLRAKMGAELATAVAAVARAGLPIRLLRAWVQVTGAGTFGLLDVAQEKV